LPSNKQAEIKGASFYEALFYLAATNPFTKLWEILRAHALYTREESGYNIYHVDQDYERENPLSRFD